MTNVQVDNVEAVATLRDRGFATTSVKALEHFSQIHEQRRLQNFDYGSEENLRRYGTPTPPEYDLYQIEGIPIALVIGSRDDEGGETDEQWLVPQISDVLVFNTTYDKFAHM